MLSTLPSGAASGEVDTVLASFAKPAGPAPLEDIAENLDEILAGDSLPAVPQAAERDPSGTGAALLEQLRGRSPLSLAVTFAQLRKGGACLSFEEAMQLEFRLAARFLRSEDFYEGVRAAVIDKDRQPRWSYPDVASVPQEVVDNYFATLDGAELELDWQGGCEGRRRREIALIGDRAGRKPLY